MSLSYTKPTWTNDEGTAINAERLQAISNVLDGLVNQSGTKPIVHLSFSGTFMTATYADGSIATVENPLKGDKGDKGDTGARGPAGADGVDGKDGKDGTDGVSLTATSSKDGKTTTVQIKNASTGEVLTTLTINDGSDGTGSGDMSKSEYASDTYGVVKKAETSDSATTSGSADVAGSVAWANTNHPTSLEGYGLVSDVNALITSAVGEAINGEY